MKSFKLCSFLALGTIVSLALAAGGALAQKGVAAVAPAAAYDSLAAPAGPPPADSGQLAATLRPLQEAVRLDSLNAQKHFELGNAYYDGGRLQDARAEFQRAVDLDSTFWKGFVNLGTVQDELGFTNLSRPAFETAIRLHPDDAFPYVKMGNSLYASLNKKEAMDYYRRALKVDPRHLETHFMLGNNYAEMDMYREAVREWKKVQAYGPGSAEARMVEENLKTVYAFFEEHPDFVKELKAISIVDVKRAK
jgi:tetratricopeptide (TPR) repeat protein